MRLGRRSWSTPTTIRIGRAGPHRSLPHSAIPAHELPGKGHVNVAAGFGPWPEALAWCEAVGAF